MSNRSISVAMATFNGARYLGEQLTSLSSQTVKPLELVVCDDGSTDETAAILQSFSALAPFTVRVFKNAERLGYQQNFIKAASLCKGSLIAFCDQDDIWNDDKLDVVTKYFRQSDDLLVAHDFSVFFENDRPSIPSYFRNLALCGCWRSGVTSSNRSYGTGYMEVTRRAGWRVAKLPCGDCCGASGCRPTLTALIWMRLSLNLSGPRILLFYRGAVQQCKWW